MSSIAADVPTTPIPDLTAKPVGPDRAFPNHDPYTPTVAAEPDLAVSFHWMPSNTQLHRDCHTVRVRAETVPNYTQHQYPDPKRVLPSLEIPDHVIPFQDCRSVTFGT